MIQALLNTIGFSKTFFRRAKITVGDVVYDGPIYLMKDSLMADVVIEAYDGDVVFPDAAEFVEVEIAGVWMKLEGTYQLHQNSAAFYIIVKTMTYKLPEAIA